jgi:hypothetical protein
MARHLSGGSALFSHGTKELAVSDVERADSIRELQHELRVKVPATWVCGMISAISQGSINADDVRSAPDKHDACFGTRIHLSNEEQGGTRRSVAHTAH